MDTNKEKWINEVLQSTEGMRRVTPDEFLFKKIETNVETQSSKRISISMMRWVSSVAAVLLLLNVVGVYYYMVIQNSASLANSDSYSQTESVSNYLNYYQ